MARLNISLTNDQAKIIQDLGKEEGKTISSVITESVDLYAKLKEKHINRDQIENLISFHEISTAIGAVPISAIMLDLSVSAALKCSEDEVMKMWCDRGHIFGELVRGIAKDITELARLVKQYETFLPTDRLEIRSYEDEVELLLIGSGYSVAASKVTAEGAKCFLMEYGFKNFEQQVAEGFVRIRGTP
ncbi:MAG: hypothetical protein LVQ63_04535 [Thermoplasmatales archaeon]|nr:hypothetical protein [Thermoplasmatales archaeon]